MRNEFNFSHGERNAAVCRMELDLIPNGNFISSGYEECRDMRFMRIAGVTNFWESDEKLDVTVLTGDILSSFVRHGIPFACAVVGCADGIRFYVGTIRPLLEGLRTSYAASYPGIDLETVENNPLRTSARTCGGLFTGIPTCKTGGEKKSFQIETVCRGMLGRNFTYLVLASGISSVAVTLGHTRLLDEMGTVYESIQHTVSGGVQGNIQLQRQDFHGRRYFENLEKLETSLRQGMARGMWRVSGYYAADNPEDAGKLGNLIKACFSGEESRPEPFRTIAYNAVRDVIPNMYMMADSSEQPDLHPLGRWYQEGFPHPITLYNFKYQTLLTSDQLSVLCQLPVCEFPGYYVDEYVEFETADRTASSLRRPVPLGIISVAGRNPVRQEEHPYLLERNDLTRHALIIGITGGGKTNTAKSLLHTLWIDPCGPTPFLVIESAKREYWELRNLKGFENLLVFTLGSESSKDSVRYRINPFETNPSLSLQTHIDYLLATFKAAFDLFPPTPYILERCVYEIYSDRGWDIVENRNRYGLTEYPTLSDLYDKIDVVVDRMGYHQEVQSNVKAALQARVSSLMIGGKGAMLNTPRSIPIGGLLTRPAVLELEDLGDDETKSFVIGILLVQLYEFRKSQMDRGAKDLSHILMVEEAHRLLKNVPESGEGGNTRARSVEFFCNLLAEIRTYGQGIIIADQIPTKLAPDTIKNTNLKIVHRTVAQDDREAVGCAMNMTPAQVAGLSSLRRGYAAVYAEGDSRPKCVRMPLMEPYYDKSRSDVLEESRRNVRELAADYDQLVRHHAACAFCEHRCRYRETVETYLTRQIAVNRVLSRLEKGGYQPRLLDLFLRSTPMAALGIENPFMALCAAGTLLHRQTSLGVGRQKEILAGYLAYKNQTAEKGGA